MLMKLITPFKGMFGFTGYTGLYGAVENGNQSITPFNLWSQISITMPYKCPRWAKNKQHRIKAIYDQNIQRNMQIFKFRL